MEDSQYPAILNPHPIPLLFRKYFAKSKNVSFVEEVRIRYQDRISSSAVQDVRDRTHDM